MACPTGPTAQIFLCGGDAEIGVMDGAKNRDNHDWFFNRLDGSRFPRESFSEVTIDLPCGVGTFDRRFCLCEAGLHRKVGTSFELCKCGQRGDGKCHLANVLLIIGDLNDALDRCQVAHERRMSLPDFAHGRNTVGHTAEGNFWRDSFNIFQASINVLQFRDGCLQEFSVGSDEKKIFFIQRSFLALPSFCNTCEDTSISCRSVKTDYIQGMIDYCGPYGERN